MMSAKNVHKRHTSTINRYFYGSPSLVLYDGRALAALGNVVVINVNYRVGPFGFMYLGHPHLPGNMGMLDQQTALKWIRENVKAFGGDPDNVLLNFL